MRRRARLSRWRQASGEASMISRDLAERHVERLAQHEHRALVGRQALEQHEHRQRDLLLVLDQLRRHVLHQRLRQPLADVGLAAHARGAQDVDRQPRRHRRQERLLVVERRAVVHAQERLLDHVLGLGDRAEHAVGDLEGERAQAIVFTHLSQVFMLSRRMLHEHFHRRRDRRRRPRTDPPADRARPHRHRDDPLA